MKTQAYTSSETELERQLLQCHKEVRFWSKVFIAVIVVIGAVSLYLASDTRILVDLLR